jgi:hypothetical protein
MNKKLLIFLSFFVIFTSACSKNKLELYNGKHYFVNEGAIIEEREIGPEIFRVSYSPEISKDTLFLHFVTSRKILTKNLEEFEGLLKSDKIREATKNEIINAELYKEKIEGYDLKNFVTVKGRTVKEGDLADDVFETFTKDMRIKEPWVARDQQGEILYVTHYYKIDGVEYHLTFKRRQQFSDEYCYDCPYRLRSISEYPYVSLTFKEYMKKYWVQTKD